MENLLKKPLFWVALIGVFLIAVIVATFEDGHFALDNDVAIRVNDTSYTFEEFNNVVAQVSQELEMYGMEADEKEAKEQAIERIIQETLLLEHARDMGVEVTQEEIDDYFQEVMASSGMESEEEFLSQLQVQGIDGRDAVDELLTIEIKMNKLIDIYSENIDIEKEDIEAMYEEYASQMEAFGDPEQGIASYEDMEGDLRAGMVQEEVYPLLLAKIDELREEADIEIFVNGINDMGDEEEEELEIEVEEPEGIDIEDLEEIEIEVEETE